MISREISKGQLVQSRAGRDQGKYFLVFDWDYEYVYVVDGDMRRVQDPKKKNIKHLWYTQKVAEEVVNKLNLGLKVTNADIRHALENLVETLTTSKEV